MNYELAKKLKDAGFPQTRPFEIICSKCCVKWVKSKGLKYIKHKCKKGGEAEAVHVPTLSELIEACGVGFDELTKMTHTKKPQRWSAISLSCEECEISEMNDGYGSTPEEAVANLWLELNKK